MGFTIEELKHISKLCALKLSENEEKRFLSQLDNIIGFVSQLKEVDVEGIEPLAHPLEGKFMDLNEGLKEFSFKKDLFRNVKHKLINNGIVIKSAIKN